ncbi:hypothetical protein [Pseudomonas sp. FYR_7]|uniref:hypothetical protein n=1 Tax=Pseudomonas sp. FYR_7 TaxID=3367174 RepID=UPI00370C645B
MTKKPTNSQPDPLEQVMATVIQGFQMTTASIQELRDRQTNLEQQLQQQARAAYHGMTASGKSRYASELVKIESEINPRGAQARVAETLGVTPGRVTQLLSSEKNRKNGK